MPTVFFKAASSRKDTIMARQGNTPTAVSKHRETAADGRKFDKVKEVGGAAPESKSAAKAARDKVHGNAFGSKGNPTVGSPGPARASNQPHTAEYAGPGQCESEGSRQGNVPHTDTSIGGYPQRKK